MKMYFSQRNGTDNSTEEDYAPVTLKESIEKEGIVIYEKV